MRNEYAFMVIFQGALQCIFSVNFTVPLLIYLARSENIPGTEDRNDGVPWNRSPGLLLEDAAVVQQGGTCGAVLGGCSVRRGRAASRHSADV